MKVLTMSSTWWHRPVIPALRRLRQENQAFNSSLSYVAKLCLQKKKKLQMHANISLSGGSTEG
jgi:hypothetical protein